MENIVNNFSLKGKLPQAEFKRKCKAAFFHILYVKLKNTYIIGAAFKMCVIIAFCQLRGL